MTLIQIWLTKYMVKISKEIKEFIEECRFYHTESMSEEVEIEIMTNGYFVSKMEGCPK